MTVNGRSGVGGLHSGYASDAGHASRPVRGGVPEHGRVPKYYAVKARLLALLAELGEGGALPAERELAAEYGVSRATLRHAISELILEGRLRAMRGRGTFVSGPKLIQPLQLGSYTEAVRAAGRRPGRRVVGVERLAAPDELAGQLAIAPGAPVIHLERVLLVDDEPLGLESTYLPADRHPDAAGRLRPDRVAVPVSAGAAGRGVRRGRRAHRDRIGHAPRGDAARHQPGTADAAAATRLLRPRGRTGSGEVVSRVEKEKSNPQADIVVTLPPFIQKAAAKGLLQSSSPAGADQVPAGSKDPGGKYLALVNNYLCFIYNPSASPGPASWDDLLADRFKAKIQYSTPGQAGDGTAVLIQLQHVLGEQPALDYLKKLQANNVGPSSSTGKLQPKVSKGEILVANGDVQMNLASINNDKSNFKIFFPADASGKKSTFALPYYMGLATGAPHADAAKKLMEFLLSTDAQQAVSKDAYGIPVRSDVTPSDANFQTVKAALDGVDLWNPDWATISSNLDSQVAAYKAALGLS